MAATTDMPDAGYPRSVHIPIEDAVQAVVAALGLGEDAGLAALAAYQDDERNEVHESADSRTVITTGATNSIDMTVGARNLLALAQTEYAIRMMPTPMKRIGITRFDVTDAMPSKTVGFRLGE